MMKKLCLLAGIVLLVAPSVRSQSREAATSGAHRLFVGGEVSTFNPDWGCVSASPFNCWNGHLVGLGAVADANHVWKNLGIEGEARWLNWAGPGLGLKESNYLAGPRYQLFRKANLALYAKGLLGSSHITRPLNLGEGAYFTLAPGGTAEYGLTWRMVIRVEYEYQIWTGFRGLPGEPINGLTPNGFSFGVGYRL
ncbi:hypothetical protein DYQ86_14535 [Acidobacteria bacterium AB60]|nr:hypothetical protein DYQ86_14535 [Acidobacteria bacterium AB60]